MKDIIEPFTDDINLINETIKKQKKSLKYFHMKITHYLSIF